MSINTDLTVLLCIKDRVEYILRWMQYANNVELPFRIIIADGGKDKELEKRLRNYSNFPKVHYTYLRYPHDKTYNDYYRKQYLAAQHVKTKYCIMADDDDFLLVGGLLSAIKYLNSNQDYIACRGGITSFNVGCSGNNYYYHDKICYYTEYARNKSIDDEYAKERVNRLFANYTLVHYSVCKTEALIENLRTVSRLSPSELPTSELILAFLLATKGKIHYSESEHLLRQYNVEGSSHVFYSKIRPKFVHLLDNEGISVLSNLISDKDDISSSQAYDLVCLLFDELSHSHNLSMNRPYLAKFLIRKVKLFISEFIKKSSLMTNFIRLYRPSFAKGVNVLGNKDILFVDSFLKRK